MSTKEKRAAFAENLRAILNRSGMSVEEIVERARATARKIGPKTKFPDARMVRRWQGDGLARPLRGPFDVFCITLGISDEERQMLWKPKAFVSRGKSESDASRETATGARIGVAAEPEADESLTWTGNGERYASIKRLVETHEIIKATERLLEEDAKRPAVVQFIRALSSMPAPR